tara:strand:+ start:91 stop:249 length:159 start_codon:yes stop_codon:yes gene_type:complete
VLRHPLFQPFLNFIHVFLLLNHCFLLFFHPFPLFPQFSQIRFEFLFIVATTN